VIRRGLVAIAIAAAMGCDPAAESEGVDAPPALDSAGEAGPGGADPGPTDASSTEAGDGGEVEVAARTWLKGDLHVHSLHSTDASDSPVAEVIAKAEQLGLDYLVITDHDNHVNGQLTTWDDPAYQSDALTLLYGTEWTTGKGHANVIGAAPFDHAPLWALRDGPGADSIAAAHAQGLHFSVNHPVAKDLWELGFELPFDSMEVWTAVFTVPNSNRQAIAKWDEILRTGRRLSVRGGSDSHHQHGFESLLFNIGNPTTWVHATDRSGTAILEALRAGRVSIGYAATAERIDLTADADGDGSYEATIGDNLSATGGRIGFRVEIVGFRDGASYDVAVIADGATVRRLTLREPVATFDATPPAGARTYYRVEVKGDTPDAPWLSRVAFGRFVGLTNPIYVGYP
jgi:hypothetical protein